MSGTGRRLWQAAFVFATIVTLCQLRTTLAQSPQVVLLQPNFNTQPPGGVAVGLPAGWTENNTSIAAVHFRDDTPISVSPNTFFKFAWSQYSPAPPAPAPAPPAESDDEMGCGDAGEEGTPANDTNPSVVVTITSNKRTAGKFRLTFSRKDISAPSQQVSFRRDPGGPDNSYIYSAFDTDLANLPAPPSIDFGGGNSRHSELSDLVARKKGEITELVMTEAAHWDSTGVDGRRKYVAKFDTYPITSCRMISRILRETADQVQAAKANSPDEIRVALDAIEKEMKVKLEEFYKSEDSKYRTINPLREDWKPFLQHVRDRIPEKYGKDSLRDIEFAELSLREVADGMERIGQVWLGAATEDLHVQQGASAGSGYGGSGDSSSTAPCGRCRKRCRCARLLFGF